MPAQHRPDVKPDGAATVTDAPPSESTVETVALDRLALFGWSVLHGPDSAPDTPGAERGDYSEVVLHDHTCCPRSPTSIPTCRRHARRSPPTIDTHGRATPAARNRDFNRMAVAGVTVAYADADGRVPFVHILDA